MGVLHDPLTGGPLLDDGDHGMVLEADRGVDPEEAALGVGDPDTRRFGSPTGRTPHDRSREPQ